MRLEQILALTGAQALSEEVDLDCEIRCAFASDLMSDVLRFDLVQGILVTGLANPQIVRTAEIADAGSHPHGEGQISPPRNVIPRRAVRIPILRTKLIMFETCGRLYEAGLPAWRFPCRGRMS